MGTLRKAPLLRCVAQAERVRTPFGHYCLMVDGDVPRLKKERLYYRAAQSQGRRERRQIDLGKVLFLLLREPSAEYMRKVTS